MRDREGGRDWFLEHCWCHFICILHIGISWIGNFAINSCRYVKQVSVLAQHLLILSGFYPFTHHQYHTTEAKKRTTTETLFKRCMSVPSVCMLNASSMNTILSHSIFIPILERQFNCALSTFTCIFFLCRFMWLFGQFISSETQSLTPLIQHANSSRKYIHLCFNYIQYHNVYLYLFRNK